MKQLIPFSKDIEFKTMIDSITNISLEHTLSLKDEYNISGDFLITGKYRMAKASPEDPFSYKIPIDITIDKKYDTHNIMIEIDDFQYSQKDERSLHVDIVLVIDNLEKIEEPEVTQPPEVENVTFDDDRLLLSDEEKKDIDQLINSSDKSEDLFKEMSQPQDLSIDSKIKKEETNTPVEDNSKEEPNTKDELKKSVGSLFAAFKDTDETFKTYSVYIMRNGDNIEDVMARYKTNREALEEYNDMSNIKIGTKLIIPTTRNEDNK